MAASQPPSLRIVVLTIALAALGLASLAQAEVTQRGNVRVTFQGQITPKDLPREGSAPVKVTVGGTIASTKAGKTPPQLQRIEISINRHGHLEPKGLPICEVDDIQPSTTAKALEACRGSLIGEGRFSAKVLLPEQAPFPSTGKIFAFNGAYKGKPAILAHVYGTDPAPTSFTLPFLITHSKGVFATTLSASLPQVTSEWGYVTGLAMALQRRFTLNGKTRSYASAGCPAPKGFPGAVFPFARATYGFAGGSSLSSTLTRSCKARG
jgi:hypothetical protein